MKSHELYDMDHIAMLKPLAISMRVSLSSVVSEDTAVRVVPRFIKY